MHVTGQLPVQIEQAEAERIKAKPSKRIAIVQLIKSGSHCRERCSLRSGQAIRNHRFDECWNVARMSEVFRSSAN